MEYPSALANTVKALLACCEEYRQPFEYSLVGGIIMNIGMALDLSSGTPTVAAWPGGLPQRAALLHSEMLGSDSLQL